MKINNLNHRASKVLAAVLAAGCLLYSPLAIHAQTTAANLSPDLQEIVKFAQAHMSDDVILSYVKNSGKTYNLSADDMLYLNGQGVSQAVISALLRTQSAAAPVSAPAPSVPPPGEPAPQPQMAPPPEAAPAPVSALFDNFGTDGGLNMGVWTTQSGLLANLAAVSGSAIVPTAVAFGPAGMQISGISGPGQFTGVQSAGSFAAPFSLTATVSGQAEMGIPFELYLVSGDMRQWVSLAGHLGGAGHREGDLHVGGDFGFFRGGANIPLGGGPSPEHGVWVNYSGSGLPISALGNKIFEHPRAGVPYNIQVTVGPDGMASVVFLDTAGMTLGARSGLPVGPGPFYLVLADRNGPTFANWNSIQLTPLAPPVAVAPAAPATPTIDYFQAQLGPYGHWMDVPGAGSCWVPAEASYPGWRPYMNSGHWEFSDAGWYWRSDYPWGEIAFHYGRWINDERTGFVWAWAPAYDWAPSWVTWRYGDGGIGWAPLPWDARFEVGVGLVYRGGVAVNIDFGLGADAFVFVGSDHFWVTDYRTYVFAPDRARSFYAHSEIHNGYRMDHGRFVAVGFGRERMAALTHHEIVVHPAHQMRQAEEHHNLAVRQVAIRADVRGQGRPSADVRGQGRAPADVREQGRAPASPRGEPSYGPSGEGRPVPGQVNGKPAAAGRPPQAAGHGTTSENKPTSNEKNQ